jgi:hypothetical protein
MTTAYTSLLGLALPVTGELSGTWGDTVNDSITSLLDTAVAGTTNVSADSNVTLTTTTGASNQARQAILLFSGARTAIRTVTAPAQSKIYTVINATTGGFAVTLVGAGPTTGVTIANGARTVVAWNGSDFVEVSSPSSIILPGGTANGVLYLNGSKVVTSGSALVFDGANLGVGVTPTQKLDIATASGDCIIRLGNGTSQARLAVDSDGPYIYALTSGDNALRVFTPVGTQAMTLDASGNLGVGTTSPANRLDVRTSGTNDVAFIVTSSGGGSLIKFSDGNTSVNPKMGANANDLVFATNTSGSATERARIDSSGNLLVQRTSPSSLGTNTKFTANVASLGGFSTSGTSAVSTNIPIDQSSSGGTCVFIASRNTSDAFNTESAVYILHFAFNGDNTPGVTYVGGSSNFVAFGKSGGFLTVQNSAGGNANYAWFGNK